MIVIFFIYSWPNMFFYNKLPMIIESRSIFHAVCNCHAPQPISIRTDFSISLKFVFNSLLHLMCTIPSACTSTLTTVFISVKQNAPLLFMTLVFSAFFVISYRYNQLVINVRIFAIPCLKFLYINIKIRTLLT